MADYYVHGDADSFDAALIVSGCIERGHRSVLLDEDGAPRRFFDLSTGVAGDLMNRLSTYRLRMAVVVPNPSKHSAAFQDFVREANRGKQARFFSTRSEAVEWLESG